MKTLNGRTKTAAVPRPTPQTPKLLVHRLADFSGTRQSAILNMETESKTYSQGEGAKSLSAGSRREYDAGHGQFVVNCCKEVG